MATSFRQRNDMTRPASRMEPLAKLPVFWDLADKRVIVVGNSDAACWKAELVAACGAHVDIFLSDRCQPVPALAALAAAREHVVLCDTDWSPADLGGAVLAIADCEDDVAARRFAAACRAAGVPFNVIDKPAFCLFQFGSIVNRSPVVVAISTDGAAPILAQAIRRRVEAVLPPALKQWAALAQRLRGKVCETRAAGAERREFWERFVDLVFAGDRPPDAAAEREIGNLLEGAAPTQTSTSSVIYVGAGPGDPDMLTLKAMRALQSADIVLHDAAIAPAILRLARREACRTALDEGPTSAAEHVISHAHDGRKVVRLVAGDLSPGWDLVTEIDRVSRAGLKSELIAGVTAHPFPRMSPAVRTVGVFRADRSQITTRLERAPA